MKQIIKSLVQKTVGSSRHAGEHAEKHPAVRTVRALRKDDLAKVVGGDSVSLPRGTW